VDRDAVKPSLQAAFAVEAFHPAKNLQEHFLRRVRGVCGIGQNSVHQAVSGLVLWRDKQFVCFFRARFGLGNNRSFLGPEPVCVGNIPQCCSSRHFSHGVTPFSQDICPATTACFVTAVTFKGTAVSSKR